MSTSLQPAEPVPAPGAGRIVAGLALMIVWCDGILRPFRDKETTTMRVHFDEKADAVYVRLDNSLIVESEEVQPGVVLDYDASNRVIGVEILGVKQRVPLADLREIHVKIA